MKQLLVAMSCVLLSSCATTSTPIMKSEHGLYQVLTQQSHGGANIRFFEVLSEPDEIRMLKSDPNLSTMISEEDLTKSNFVILNMGEKPTGGYSISVADVQETADKVLVTVKESAPAPDQMTISVITNPYVVVKINSKKEIEFQ